MYYPCLKCMRITDEVHLQHSATIICSLHRSVRRVLKRSRKLSEVSELPELPEDQQEPPVQDVKPTKVRVLIPAAYCIPNRYHSPHGTHKLTLSVKFLVCLCVCFYSHEKKRVIYLCMFIEVPNHFILREGEREGGSYQGGKGESKQ